MRFFDVRVAVAVGVFGLCLSCSKNDSLTSGRKDPGQAAAVQNLSDVKTVLIAKDADDQKRCVAEIIAAGGRVLYQGPQGVILTNKPQAELKFKTCMATVGENQALTKAPEPREVKTEPSAKSSDFDLQRLLPKDEIAARQFLKDHPTFDGRGVTVAVLDTGMEVNHPMLQKTTTGEDKIVDAQDLSGIGTLKVADVKVDKESFGHEKVTYSIKGITGKSFRFGKFAGSTINWAPELGKEDKFEDFGVLVYQNAKNEWVARLDADNNKDFSNDEELSSFRSGRKFAKLGKEKKLVVAVTLEKEGKSVSLMMSDAGHSTHVAGIIAGNDPKSFTGIAPGAKILAARLADGRFAGGPTTTASMLLAIDYAVANKADIINMSYGTPSAFNNGDMAIEQYVNKVASEQNMLFAISAGNEGPGVFTVGSPGAATLAISVGAYLSPEMAREMYSSFGMPAAGLFNFSSIGPRRDGGWRPSVVAPGSAFSSLPYWEGKYGRQNGTSMAAPQVAGALALLVSAAKQEKLQTDRASITHALVQSAKPVAGLNLMEQGHGLVNVNAAYDLLKKLKTPVAEYIVDSVVPSPLPGSKGKGILVQSEEISTAPILVTMMTPQEEPSEVRRVQLKPSAAWIKTPESIGLQSGPSTFQVYLEKSPALAKPGMYTEKISGIEPNTGLVVFEVPVTVIVPEKLTAGVFVRSFTHNPGTVQRMFFQVPAGTSSAQVSLSKILESRLLCELRDPDGLELALITDTETSLPQEAASKTIRLTKSGTYELVLFSSAYSSKPVSGEVRVSFNAFRVHQKVNTPTDATFEVVNLLDTVKITPKVQIVGSVKSSPVTAEGGKSSARYDIDLTQDDLDKLASLKVRIVTPRSLINKMTDYGYVIWNGSELYNQMDSLHTDSTLEIKLPPKPAKLSLEIYTAFTAKEAPKKWAVALTEMRTHKNSKSVYEGKRTRLDVNKSIEFDLSWGELKDYMKPAGFVPLPLLTLEGLNGEILHQSYLTH